MDNPTPQTGAEEVALEEGAADEIAQKTADLVAASEVKSLRAEIAELKAALLTPKRTDLGDVPAGGIIAKGSDPAFYGGNDQYTYAGSDDAEVATNLWLAEAILKGNDSKDRRAQHELSPRAKQVMLAAAERALKSAPKPIPAVVEINGRKVHQDPGGFVAKQYADNRVDAYKALTAAAAGSGLEWVPTFATSELWRDFHLAATIAPQFRRYDMPTNPYTLPVESADVTFRYVSTENVAVTASQPTTAAATLTARKIQAEVDFSGEVTEDSIVPVIPNLRFDLVRRGGQTIDDLVVNGDTNTAASGNVANDDGAPAAGSYFLAFNGLRKFWNVTNSAQETNMAAAPTTALLNNIRKLLGRYGARPSDLILLTGPATYYALQVIAEVITLEKYGPNATVLTGELARWFNIPILLNETTDKVASNGRTAVVTPANNTTGWAGIVNTTMWKTGFRRDLQIESYRDIQKDQNILVASFRMAFTSSGISTQISAGARNITV
jgi:HK97 family phage major capsid protein